MTKLWNGPKLWDSILQHFPDGSIVAGGCIRDFYMGNQNIKDVDVFYPYRNMDDYTHLVLNDKERFKYIREVPVNNYGRKEHLAFSEEYEDRNNGIIVNIMGVRKIAPMEYMYNFDLGTSRCLYDGNLFYTDDFMSDMKNKEVSILNPTISYEWSKARAERVVEKYKDFVIVDKSGENTPALS